MFKIVDVEQGSPEWHKVRLGKWTASNFSKLLTPTLKTSTQTKDFVNGLVGELLTGEYEEGYKSAAMQRGNDLESEALEFVNFTHGHDFKTYGFCDSEQGYGASPDALDLEKKIGLELKCPSAKTMVKYLRSGKLPNEYFSQVQGSMLVTGFKTWIFCAYHPLMKPLLITVKRDQEYIGKLRTMLVDSCIDIKKIHAELSNG